MRITSIRKVSGSSFVDLFVDGKWFERISICLLAKEKIFKGQEIDKTFCKNLRAKAFEEKVLKKVLDFISIRIRSSKEIELFLIKHFGKSFDFSKMISKLKKLGLINDLKFAKFWTEIRIINKGRGINFLTSSLKEKGVSQGVIEKVISEFGFNDENFALQTMKKNMKKFEMIRDEKKRKIGALSFLTRRGFTYRASINAYNRCFKTIKNVKY